MTTISRTQLPRTTLSRAIASIGEESFSDNLLEFLHDVCGAEHCAVLRFKNHEPTEVLTASHDGTDTAHRQIMVYLDSQYWRYDPSISELRKVSRDTGPRMVRVDIASLPRRELRERIYGVTGIIDRAYICGGDANAPFGLSVLRSRNHGPFSSFDLDQLQDQLETIVSMLNRHFSFLHRRSTFANALTSLDAITSCIRRAPERLPRREAEVCARIIYGVSTIGIALELGIGEETVMTYRKRIYQRLGIGTQRELVVWYLSLWSHGCQTDPVVQDRLPTPANLYLASATTHADPLPLSA